MRRGGESIVEDATVDVEEGDEAIVPRAAADVRSPTEQEVKDHEISNSLLGTGVDTV